MVTFSVIVPIYKVEKYVEKCIQSILDQTFTDFELLCIDDCGGDNSIKIVEELAEKDDRIKIFYQEKNKGVSAARNLGLDNAKGEYIFFVDADDWIDKETLLKTYKAFRKAGTESVWLNGKRFWENTQSLDSKRLSEEKTGIMRIIPESIAAYLDVVWMKSFTKKSIDKYKLRFPEDIKLNEDGEFYLKYYTYFPKVYNLDEVLYYYRTRMDSAINSFCGGKGSPEDFYTIIKRIKSFWQDLGCYERYKMALIKLMLSRIDLCRKSCYRNEYIKISKELLENLKFPEDFQEFNRNKEPLVSIVIPLYNTEEYVEESIRSIINQSYKNLEIIVVDDCSTDNSLEIVKKLAEEDSRIKIYRHKKNKRAGGARNTGLKHASGEFFMSIDSDDVMLQDCIRTCVYGMNVTGFDSVWFKADLWFPEENKRIPLNYAKYYNKMNTGYLTLLPEDMAFYPYVVWNKMYRKSALDKNKIKWRENVTYDDNDFYFNFFTQSPDIYIFDKCFMLYRQREDSIMQTGYKDINKAKSIYDTAYNVYKDMKKNKVFEKYKETYMNYMLITLGMFSEDEEFDKKLNKYKLDFFNKVNFPEEYKELKIKY